MLEALLSIGICQMDGQIIFWENFEDVHVHAYAQDIHVMFQNALFIQRHRFEPGVQIKKNEGAVPP